MEENFAGGLPLQKLLTQLFDNKVPDFRGVDDFIEKLKSQFRVYLKKEKIFVDTFRIQRDAQNTYCLFFFTSHQKGFKAMLEAKWKLDAGQGKGFKIENTGELFSEVEVSQYPEKLLDFIKGKDDLTNKDIELFGLESGFLPSHSTKILKTFIQPTNNIEVVSLDNLPVKKGGFYIDNDERLVIIRINKK